MNTALEVKPVDSVPEAMIPHDHEYELYTYGESLCSQMVRIACEEKEIEWFSKPIVLSEVAVNSNNLTPEYLAINPKARVPSLVHNGRPVLDSYEIIKYLDLQNPHLGVRLYPDDPDIRQQVDSWVLDASLRDDGKFGKSLGMAIPIVSAPVIRICLKRQPLVHVFTKFSKHPVADRRWGFRILRLLPVPKGMADRSIRAIAQALVNIETELAQGRNFILGTFTQIDVMMMAHFHRLEDVGFGSVLCDDTLPNIAAYWSRLKTRPSYRTAVLDYHDKNWRDALHVVFKGKPSPDIPKLQAAISAAQVSG